jgi:hypothetical protein
MTRYLLVLAVLGLQAGASFDASGVDAFWRVQGQLARGVEPEAAQWDALFATPGYAALQERERRRPALEQAMRLAFMSSMSAARDSAARTATFTGRAVAHLMGAPAARDSMERFLASLRASDVVGVARRRVAAYLPRGLADSNAPPPVALVLFLNDGRGYPSVIVADLLRLTRTGVDTSYFAHEFFHYYRRQFARARPTPAARDAGIDELLAYPAEEGVADQLDKRAFAEMPDDQFAREMARPGAPAYLVSYRDAYRRAPEWMAKVSRALERGLDKPDSATIFARAMRDSIPDQGRALGSFMASTIDRAAGRAALIAAAADTYEFWIAYDGVAERSPGAPRLTARAMMVVRRLSLPPR